MIKAGASGYVLKDSMLEELVSAIDQVRMNRMYISPTITRNVVYGYKEYLLERDSSTLQSLTSREKEASCPP